MPHRIAMLALVCSGLAGGHADVISRDSQCRLLQHEALRRRLLLGYAGALRRSELVGIDVEHLRVHARPSSYRARAPKATRMATGSGPRIGRGKGRDSARCAPMASQQDTIDPGRLSPGAARLIRRKRAGMAGVKSTQLEPVTIPAPSGIGGHY